MYLALMHSATTTSHLVVLVHRTGCLLVSPRVKLSAGGWGAEEYDQEVWVILYSAYSKVLCHMKRKPNRAANVREVKYSKKH